MRWFVEISSLGQGPQPSRTLCVEAPQWQPALQKARALRGDDGPLSNFSIELLESGYRAIDPTTRLRYVVQRAPDDAVLTDGTALAAGSWPAPPAPPDPAQLPPMRPMAETVPFISEGLAMLHEMSLPPAPVVAREEERRVASEPPASEGEGEGRSSPPLRRAQTIAFSSEGAAAIRAAVVSNVLAAPARAVAPEAPAAPETPARALPQFELLSKREENPTERSPLTYREMVYAVAPGTPEPLVEALLRDRFEVVRRSLEEVRPGKLVTLAVFDHVFRGRPERRPLATLTWKDWRSQGPEIAFPLRDGEAKSAPPSSVLSSSITPSFAPSRSDRPVAPVAPRAAASAPPRRRPSSIPPKGGARLSGDDLISELFEACSDLHFLRDALEGADFVLALTLEKIPSAVGLVSLFDIDRREFVVVRQRGGKSALLSRLSDRAPLAQAAMRSQRAVVVPDASRDERALDDRWKAIGAGLKSVICAPVELGGRTLGLIEIANPLDGGRYDDGDGNALTYIGQQFAEFVGARGVIVEPGAVTAGAKTSALP